MAEPYQPPHVTLASALEWRPIIRDHWEVETAQGRRVLAWITEQRAPFSRIDAAQALSLPIITVRNGIVKAKRRGLVIELGPDVATRRTLYRTVTP